MQESPAYIKMSLAAAMTLGYRPGRFYRCAHNKCINLLLTYEQGCAANCAYCGLARERRGQYSEKSFIRVEWPTCPTEETIARIAAKGSAIKRVCISMITHKRAVTDTATLIGQLQAQVPDVPVAVLSCPTILSRADYELFKERGADRIGIAVDLANAHLFDKMRGAQARGPHRWQDYWDKIRLAQEVFGAANVGIHLMVGMGETEKEMAELIGKIHDLGSSTHLFSFYPEAQSAMAQHPQPPMGQYRRIQLARYLIDNGLDHPRNFRYNEDDEIIAYGLERSQLEEIISRGTPFETSGCPGHDGQVACNRPFANSLPGPDVRNFPYKPNAEELERVRSQLWEYTSVRT